jgi:uncharacterized membrane protein
MSSGDIDTPRSTAEPSGWRAAPARNRLVVMIVVGGAMAVAVGLYAPWPYALLAGWDTAALIFTAWVWLMLASMSSADTAAHATREEPGRAQTDVMVLLSAVASLAAVGYVLVQASSATGAGQDLLAGVGVLSVALSWSAVHTLFSLRYARLYYGGNPGGINFNQQAPPRYLDFAYVAFTIGMTFQVSDTDLESPPIRTTALEQALLAYLFGAVVPAATINLIAGLASSGGGGG